MKGPIQSNGGPLIMVEDRLLPFWGGIENLGGLESVERDCFASGRECDYNRAGQVEGWIGTVPVKSGVGIVFWGDHLALSYHQADLSTLLVVRAWYHMDDLGERVAAIMEQPPSFEVNSYIDFVSDGLTIFDSAHPGFDIAEPTLRVSLKPGRYAVSTCHDADARKNEITLHRLQQQS